ncbi:hypothetical protein COMNV_00620 [Commensalibacter sp. Nvir]|uniref:hypothetical protein n=1 Tax=Commensalibacter sp. Nvir TaxID=3069817 RepID=UPI002D614B73|nr:hypothetical protein COMNV_00620 [Commensalibacter sp. Nvir]
MKHKKLMLSIIAACNLGLTASAFAQEWMSSCGQEPKAPTVNTSTINNYNNSIENFNAYNKAIRAYYSCIAKLAHDKQLAISQKAKSDMDFYQKASSDIRTRITATLTKLQNEIKTGGQKIGIKKSS